MSSLPSVDLITPCRNRVEYLRSSLPSWLACGQISRIIVVDFNSTTPVSKDLGDVSGERVTVVRVENEPLWRQGRAQNVGLALAQADLVLKIDADVSIVDLETYVDTMARDPGMFYKGYSKMGTSSGLCLAPRRKMRAVGGYHDHMSGWGADDVDFYRRLGKRKLKRPFFHSESFREQGQRMAGKNSEAPRLDTELLSDPQSRASQPFFTGFRNSLLARIHRQTRRIALRWRYSPAPGSNHLVHAELRGSCRWRLQLARHHTELANILALAYYQQFDSVWDLMRSDTFERLVAMHQLPRFTSRQERKQLLQGRLARRQALKELADELGLELL
ncbi:MAG: glycosyltransferase family 2 protein [Prochlorococcaceae cyanobacterium]